MQDISNLHGIFNDVQALQGKLKSRLADVEQNAEKFKTALQTAVKPEAKAELVTSLKEKSSTLLNGNGYATDLVSQIQASLAALGEQWQAPPVAAAPVATPASTPAAAPTVAPVASAPAATTTMASTGDTGSKVTTAAVTTPAVAKAPAATPPVVAPAPTIAPVNTTHPPYRVYDPTNPSAFVEPSNPGGGPNLLAANLVFNPDPRPDSVHSLKYPVAVAGTVDRGEQLKNYEIAYEKLCAENNVWNQKNIEIRNQTLLASPYAAFANSKGINLAAQADPYYLAHLADPTKVPG